MHRQTEPQQWGDGSPSHINHGLLAGGVEGSALSQFQDPFTRRWLFFFLNMTIFANALGRGTRLYEAIVKNIVVDSAND